MVDKLGWPTLDGLVDFYTEGIDEQHYFLAILRAVDGCLKRGSAKYHVQRSIKPEHGQQCDLSFDLFDCITDKIIDYCSTDSAHADNHLDHHHESHGIPAELHIYH